MYLEDMPIQLSVLGLHPLGLRDEEVPLSQEPVFTIPHLFYFVSQIHDLI